MKAFPLLLLLCCAASLPPMPPMPVYSPKDTEFRKSLAKVATASAIAPQLARAAPLAPVQGFSITNIAVTPQGATMAWQGGVQPVWVMKSTDLTNWQPDGDPTIRTSHTVPITNQMFFRVRQAVPLLLAQTNAPRLVWRIPEIAMADTFDHFTIERSASGVAADCATTNGTLNAPITALPTLTGKTTVGGAGFKIPQPGSPVVQDSNGQPISSITVGDSTWMVDNVSPTNPFYVNVPGKGLFLVLSRPDTTHVILQYDISNGQGSGCAPPSISHAGETVIAGSQIVPGSYSDLVAPSPTLFYRVTGITANAINVIENVVSMSSVAPPWPKLLSGSSIVSVIAVKIKSNGNFIIAGYFAGSLDLGAPTGTMDSLGSYDIFLAEFTSSAVCLWSKRYGSTGTEQPMVMDLDVSDNILLAVNFNGTVNAGGVNHTSVSGSSGNFLVAKYSTTGDWLWEQVFGGKQGEFLTGIAADRTSAINANQDVLITGTFSDTCNFVNGNPVGGLDFGSGTPILCTSAHAVFVARLSGIDGHCLWSTLFRATIGDSSGGSIVIDSQGKIFIAGSFHEEIDFGTKHLLAASDGINDVPDIYLAKLNGADGTPVTFGGSSVWAFRFGDVATDSPSGLALDPSDNLFMVGTSFSSSIDLGGGAINNTAFPHSFGFMVKLSGANGSHVSSVGFIDTVQKDAVATVSVAIDPTGSAIASGTFNYSMSIVTVGGSVLQTLSSYGSGAGDTFLARFSNSLTYQSNHATHFGGSGGSISMGKIAIRSADRNIICGGGMYGTETFAQGVTLSSPSNFSGWLHDLSL